MKTNCLLLFLLLFVFDAASQHEISEKLILSVEKNDTYTKSGSPVNLKFKPTGRLKIKTVGGKRLISSSYYLQDSAIVLENVQNSTASSSETILLRDIASIKGKVYGNTARKIGGVIIALSALPLGFFPVFIVSYGGGPGLLVALPFLGMSAAGIGMMGARKFKTTDVWSLKIAKE